MEKVKTSVTLRESNLKYLQETNNVSGVSGAIDEIVSLYRIIEEDSADRLKSMFNMEDFLMIIASVGPLWEMTTTSKYFYKSEMMLKLMERIGLPEGLAIKVKQLCPMDKLTLGRIVLELLEERKESNEKLFKEIQRELDSSSNGGYSPDLLDGII